MKTPSRSKGLPEPVVRVIEERRFDPARRVRVEHEGTWWPGYQRAWRLCDDGLGWRAQVEYTVDYDWGPGKHLALVPAERLRPFEGDDG